MWVFHLIATKLAAAAAELSVACLFVVYTND